MLALPMQFEVFVPITVYVVVVVGVTKVIDPVALLLQLYVVAPVAVKVTVVPTQIKLLLDVAVTVGNATELMV